jgi:histidinol-phosphatase (PHP family)
MKYKVNYHMHSTGSDGTLSPEKVVEEAIACGITHMCFTDHYKTPNNFDIESQDAYQDSDYEEILKVQKKYGSKLDISVGVEFDWVEGYSSWYANEISKRKYDYVIGSVHGLLVEKDKFLHIWKEEKLKILINKFGGEKKFVKEFYGQVRELIKSGLFDGVGHFDLIKIKNNDNRLFSEEDKWYREEILKTLDLLKKTKMCLEINTKGLLLMGEGKQYPSEWILVEANKRGIPLTVGTDFHRPGDNLHIDKAHELAMRVGYKTLLIFKDRKPMEVKI